MGANGEPVRISTYPPILVDQEESKNTIQESRRLIFDHVQLDEYGCKQSEKSPVDRISADITAKSGKVLKIAPVEKGIQR